MVVVVVVATSDWTRTVEPVAGGCSVCAVAGSGRARGGSGPTRRACRSSGEGNTAGLKRVRDDFATRDRESGRAGCGRARRGVGEPFNDDLE